MFIDANVFIHAYISKDTKGRDSKKFLSRLINGEQVAITSPLIFDEVIHVILMNFDKKNAKNVWNNMIKIQNLKIYAIDEKTMSYVMHFIEEGLEPRDAFHAATMYVNGITTICSYDKHFDNIKGIKRQEPK
jgi:predicted nucleic acid-binding protein